MECAWMFKLRSFMWRWVTTWVNKVLKLNGGRYKEEDMKYACAEAMLADHWLINNTARHE